MPVIVIDRLEVIAIQQDQNTAVGFLHALNLICHVLPERFKIHHAGQVVDGRRFLRGFQGDFQTFLRLAQLDVGLLQLAGVPFLADAAQSVNRHQFQQ